MRYPFEASIEEIAADPEPFVDAVFDCLESAFLRMPKGKGFVDYPPFEKGYEALKSASSRFGDFSADKILDAVLDVPVSLIVLRTILGFSPPEWAYITTEQTGTSVTQGYARSLDRRIRLAPLTPLKPTPLTILRVTALVETAKKLIEEGVPNATKSVLHRLEKADTIEGLASVRSASQLGVPYAMLLYERFLGRPFAAHRDSVSELVGDSLESAIEDVLHAHGISYRKTKRAERIVGFDQAPDFVIPSEYNPAVVIEAKLTEDDGTARDKVTRIQHLHSLSIEGQPDGKPRFQVIACIAGRGFRVRREDMKKLILATMGKVFAPRNLDKLVTHSDLKNYVTGR